MSENTDAQTLQSTSLAIETAVQQLQQIRQQVSKAVVGQTEIIEQVLIALLAAGHVLIEGVPGLGKTLLVQALAKTFKGNFTRIQFTPDLMPSDITGHSMYNLNSGEFKIRRGPIFTHLLLADEINRAPAKSQSALLEVMQEQQVTIEGKAFAVPQPFMTLATQNPVEQEGTYPLPEAQLDRFLLKIRIDYPSFEEEKQLVKQITSAKTGQQLDVSQVETLLSPDMILTLQQLVAQQQVDDKIYDYAVRIVGETRQHSGIRLGAGPRASIALIRAARAAALLAGRDFVLPDDIKSVALPVLRHRVSLAPELELEGQTIDRALTRLIEKIETPKIS